jgi:hypothetical protein
MRIPGGLVFMWGVFPSFRFRVLVAASQKKPDFGTPKMEKALFVVDPSWEFPALRPRLSRVLSHVYEEGDTSKIDVASLSILTHVATYIWGK